MTTSNHPRLRGRLLTAIAYAAIASVPGYAFAAPQDGASETSEIIVTAQKRTQSVNSVPISITAATGETLLSRGVTSTSDLAKIVPGLTAQPSPFNTPVYTLRGIGFYDSTLAAPPTVAVYTDEVPLPYSAMTKAAALDVARVEVLKGPQGTLFGQNTTGGAINYVAARPTDNFAAGLDTSFGRFSTLDVQGFVSGPVASNMRARLSARTIQSDDWQESFTRNDTLGAQHMTQGRFLLDWDVSDPLSVTFNLNGWKDTSENQAPQRWSGYISAPTATPQRQALSINYPLVPSNARAADWGTDLATPKRDDYFVQGSVRMDYALSDAIKVTSITAYERYKTDSYQEYDGTTLRIADVFSRGHINTFSQELRIAGETDRLNWVIGGNYEADNTYDLLTYRSADSTTTDQGPFSWDATRFYADQKVRTTSVFANVEYEIVQRLSLTGGMRYTDSRRKFVGCSEDTRDVMPDVTSAGPFFNAVFGVSIPPGG
ncbi:MAG: TonB-dependent receptor, partial [Thermomicrobiales bacterium]